MDSVAGAWLKEFDYDIVRAEKSIGKKNTRAKAKMVLFARTFGGGPNAIKDLMYVDYDTAKEFLDDYAKAFPRIESYISERTQVARDNGGFIYNLFGRRLSVDLDKAYKSVNYTVQGTAADLLKIGMIKVDQHLQDHPEYDAHMVLTIHDEIVIEAPPWLPIEIIEHMRSLMEDSEGKIPIETPVDVEIARRHWTEKDSLDAIYTSA
jgi:DNA polymerase-1